MTPEQPPLFESPVLPPPQPMPQIFRFLLAAVLVVLANIVVGLICFSLFGAHPALADALYRWLTSILLIGGFIVFARLLDRCQDDVWEYIGLPSGRSSAQQTVIGLSIGAVLVTVAVAAMSILGQLSISTDFSGRALARSLLITVLLIGGALLEEVMFRGYPFQRLVDSIGPWLAILVFSALFGAVHLGNPNAGGIWSWGFFNTIFVGVLFAYAYLRTRTLWLPIGLHFGWNFFLGVVYGLPVSGLRDFSVVVRTSAQGPTLLTGGAYGIEASLTGALAILLGFVLVSWAPIPVPAPATLPGHEVQTSI